MNLPVLVCLGYASRYGPMEHSGQSEINGTRKVSTRVTFNGQNAQSATATS
jgi:hypothetical protein